MNVLLKDLNPQIAEKIKARVNFLLGKQNLDAEEMSACEVLQKRRTSGWEFGGQAFARMALGAGVGAVLGLLFGDNIPILFGVGMGAALGGWLGSMAALFHIYTRATTIGQDINAVELRTILPLATLSTTEATYMEVVCSLLESGNSMSKETGRDILQALGTIMEHYRHVETQLERLKKIVGTESVQALEAEHSRLVERVAEEDDAQAREDLKQSLTMCAKRLQDVQALGPSIERLEAQKEVLHQTLLTIQASVVRLQAAPRAVTLPDTTEIRQAVDEVTVQTRAVEDAVAEVLVLQSRG